MFLQYVKKWESTGFITSDVWSNIDSIIDIQAIDSAVSSTTMGDTKDDALCLEDRSDGRLLSCVARYIIDSRALHFTVDMLALHVNVYLSHENIVQDDKHRMNFEVCFEVLREAKKYSNVFKL